MKKLLVLLFLSIVALPLYAADKTDHVNSINIYGSEWGNSWSGGVLFALDSMPAGVSFFTFRKDDAAYNAFLSTLLSVKASEKKLKVVYDPAKTDANGYTAVRVLVIP